MKKVNFLTMAAVALMMGFAGCSNDDDVVVNEAIDTPQGDPTTIQLVIPAPTARGAYSAGDPNASGSETDIRTLTVLIYRQTATDFVLENITKGLSFETDFTRIGETDTYQLNEEITVTTGAKRIFVAANLPGFPFPEVGTPIRLVNELFVELTEPDDLSNPDSGFAMFSDKAKEATLVSENDEDHSTKNKVSVSVKRLVAKISVQRGNDLGSGETLEVLDGKVSDLQFGLDNINRTSYLLQKLVGVDPYIVVQDKNWETFSSDDFFSTKNTPVAYSPAYQKVDPIEAAVGDGINPVYAPENTAKTYDADGSNLTYISIRAKFTPNFFCDGNGNKISPEPTGPVPFWTVALGNGELYYFNDNAHAQTFHVANPNSVISEEYVGGYCYWRGFLNAEGHSGIEGVKAGKYDILRNVYYKAVINKINTLGYPSDQGAVTETASLTMDVTVVPWETVEEGWDL